ncbi:MAG TPA: hypothetical protein VND93_15955 [Myxococcales bacterium]|nr:hypothetical protein [Myxococcales bacterium]
MNQSQTTSAEQTPSQPPPQIAAKPCASGTAPVAKKKKLSLDIEEIGEVLERKISP